DKISSARGLVESFDIDKLSLESESKRRLAGFREIKEEEIKDKRRPKLGDLPVSSPAIAADTSTAAHLKDIRDKQSEKTEKGASVAEKETEKKPEKDVSVPELTEKEQVVKMPKIFVTEIRDDDTGKKKAGLKMVFPDQKTKENWGNGLLTLANGTGKRLGRDVDTLALVLLTWYKYRPRGFSFTKGDKSYIKDEITTRVLAGRAEFEDLVMAILNNNVVKVVDMKRREEIARAIAVEALNEFLMLPSEAAAKQAPDDLERTRILVREWAVTPGKLEPMGAPMLPATGALAPGRGVSVEEGLRRAHNYAAENLLASVNEQLKENIDLAMRLGNTHQADELRKIGAEIDKYRKEIHERPTGAVEGWNNIMRLLEKAGLFQKSFVPMSDIRQSRGLYNKEMLEQIALQATWSGTRGKAFIRPIVAVEEGQISEVESIIQEISEREGKEAKVEIVVTQKGEDIVSAFKRGIERMKKDQPDLDFDSAYTAIALAENNADIKALGTHFKGKKASEVFNALVVNSDAIFGQEAMMPTMNLMSIMVRMAAKAEGQPILLALECENTEIWKGLLGGIFNLIPVNAIDIFEKVENFINTIAKIRVAL
ncbi:hypothetical protein ACFL5Y_03160, partial [Candidatus Omnitrophota bacterium]